MRPQLKSAEWHDIPELDIAFAASSLEPPAVAWGSLRRRSQLPGGTWHFYVSDERFARVWSRYDDPLATMATAAVEPNWSILDHTPLPEALWHVYRKRWLARYWGERGLQVWVDLNVAHWARDLNLLGVPDGWPSYATRGYSEHPEYLDTEYSLACGRFGGKARFLVVGGGEPIQSLCLDRGWLYCGDRSGSALRGLEAVHGKV